MGNGGQHLQRDIRQAGHFDEVAHLGRHDLGRPDDAVQGRVVDDATDRGRVVFPEEDAALTLHAAGQPRCYQLVGDAGKQSDEGTRVVLSLEQAVDDGRGPDAKADCLVLMLSPRPQAWWRPRLGFLVVLTEPPPALREDAIARNGYRLGRR